MSRHSWGEPVRPDLYLYGKPLSACSNGEIVQAVRWISTGAVVWNADVLDAVMSESAKRKITSDEIFPADHHGKNPNLRGRMKIEKPGIYKGMLAEDYFADPCIEPSLSQSLCKILIEQSPLHAKMAHPRLVGVSISSDDDTAEKYDKAKAIGNAAHFLMLRRGKMIKIIEQKNFMTKVAKEEKQAAIDAGLEPVLIKHWHTAVDMSFAAWTQLGRIDGCQMAFAEDCGDGEVVVASCEDGQWLRSMIDWITPDLREVWDLKTSGMSASPYNTGKMMASAGWHLQAAMHERILDAIDPDGAGRRKFRYVCQENESPFALTVNEIGESALTIGRKQIDYAISAWRRCVETNTWPAYPLRIIRPELPAWAETSWINREIAEYDDDNYGTSPGLTALQALTAG